MTINTMKTMKPTDHPLFHEYVQEMDKRAFNNQPHETFDEWMHPLLKLSDYPEAPGLYATTFPTSSNPKQLYGDKKLPVQWVPPVAIAYLGMALREGGKKYGPYNWRDLKVESMTYVGAALRHILAYLDGEDIDPDSGNPHIAHAMACMAITADATEGGFLIDNRPTKGAVSTVLKNEERE